MSLLDDRFKVIISVAIEKRLDDGTHKPFSRTIQVYDNMKYEQMQRTQETVISSLVQSLIPLGTQIAESLEEQRAAM